MRAPPSPPTSSRPSRPSRPCWARAGERGIEWIIRLSGVSAILFVLAIFFFVFREAAPVVFRSERFSLFEFLFSTQWYPTSAVNVRYGTLALTLGSFSVTALAMLIGPRVFQALEKRRERVLEPAEQDLE